MLVTDTGDGEVVYEIDKESVVLAVAAADAPIPLSAGVVLAAVRLARVQADVAGAKESATCRDGDGDGSSALFFTERDAFHTAHSWSVEETRGPLSKPTRRGKHSVPLPSLPVSGTGLGYRRHVPLTTKIRVNDAEGVALPCLVDTGASLCSIDAALLAQLGGEAGGTRIPIHGIGHTESLGYTTITFFVDAHDDSGMPVQLEARQDFHVLPSFAPGLLLGLDFSAAHHLVLEPGKGKASVGSYTFAVRESMTGPHAVEAELCLVESVVVPARSQCWVPVDVGSLTPQIDYAVHPRVIVSMDESVQIVGPMALFNASRGHLLLTNVGSKEVVLDRRTPVADAVAARLGDVYVPTSGTFTLVPGLVPSSAPAYTHQTEIDPPSVPDSLPIDMFEGEHGFGSELAKGSATVLVDGHWRVGLDEAGAPHADIVALLRRHEQAFALDGRPGRVVGPEMEIKLIDDAGLRSEAPRRASPAKRQAMDASIDQLLAWDVIEPSASPVSFPVLIVRQNNKWRMCVDYRNLNANTVPDRYPLPRIDAVFNTLSGKRIFSSLNAIRGYHQLGVRAEDRWKTAFVCHRGLYQYKTVPFGLRNAPSVFQRVMDRILGDLRWQDAVVYIDDVVVASYSMAKHVVALDKLLGRAADVGLRFSPAKCTFGVPSLVLLGRKVSGAGLAVWKERASAVSELRRPTTLRELYHVLGLFGYYRPFVDNFAAIAEPLTSITKGWRYEHSDGRYRLVNADGKPASADRVVLPWSLAAQRSFDTLRVAIATPPVLAHPDPSRPFILYVDASKLAFAAVLHQVFEHDIPVASVTDGVVAKLATHQVSRLPSPIARERWVAWLRQDRMFAAVLRQVEAGEDASWLLDDVLLVRRVDGRLALPEGALPDLLRAAHDDTGHFGFSKTFLALSKDFWRPGLATAVRAWVKYCLTCQTVKLPRRVGTLRVDNDPQEPFEAISVDLALGLPRVRNGVDAVLVMLDLFSRMVLLEPCSSDVTAEGIAAIISDRVLRMGWRPRRLVSDSEARMTGAVMQELARSLGATVVASPPHHQQANTVERFIQTVQVTLRAMCLESKRAWDRRAVPAVELAVNSTPNVSTGLRPFDLVFISHPSIVHAVFDALEHEGVGSFQERLAAAAERLVEARETLVVARAEQKRRYDARRQSLPVLAVGDKVFVRLTDRPVPGAITSKLDIRKLGPFPVAEVLSSHRICLALPHPLRIHDVFSVEQLDVVPAGDDPFAGARVAPSSLPSPVVAHEEENASVESTLASDEEVEDLPLVPRPSRAPRLPVALREYDVGLFAARVDEELLRKPSAKARSVMVEGREIALLEHPVAFLSRLSSVTEKKLVAPELELCCLAWAIGRLLHLLEGAPVTVVTDHQSLGPMLTAGASNEYGPMISKCRAMIMPHLPNLRFVYKPGRKHKNADALSRLIAPADDDDLDDQ